MSSWMLNKNEKNNEISGKYSSNIISEAKPLQCSFDRYYFPLVDFITYSPMVNEKFFWMNENYLFYSFSKKTRNLKPLICFNSPENGTQKISCIHSCFRVADKT